MCGCWKLARSKEDQERRFRRKARSLSKVSMHCAEVREVTHQGHIGL
jgi:hypothetical protein